MPLQTQPHDNAVRPCPAAWYQHGDCHYRLTGVQCDTHAPTSALGRAPSALQLAAGLQTCARGVHGSQAATLAVSRPEQDMRIPTLAVLFANAYGCIIPTAAGFAHMATLHPKIGGLGYLKASWAWVIAANAVVAWRAHAPLKRVASLRSACKAILYGILLKAEVSPGCAQERLQNH